MELDRPPPFELLRARGLLTQSFAAAMALLVAGEFIFGAGLSEDAAANPGYLALFYLGVSVVLVLRMRAARLDVRTLVGPAPTREQRGLFAVAIPLAALSVAGFWVLFLPLSFAFPDFVQRRALEGAATLAPTSVGAWLGHTGVAVVIAPVVEEVLFRGLLLQRWALKWGTPAAVVASSLLFALLHVEVAGHFLFAVAMCALYLRTRSLWMPIGAHALNNALASLFTLSDALSPDARRTMTLSAFRSQWAVGLVMLIAGLGLLEGYRRRYWSDVDLRALFRGPVPYAAPPREPTPQVSS